MLGEGEDLKIRARLDTLRNNKNDFYKGDSGGGNDDNNDDEGGYPQPPSLAPLPPIELSSFLTPPTPPAPLRSAKKKNQGPPPDDYPIDVSDNEDDQINFIPKTDPVFETDFNRPTTSLIHKTNNVIEMVPKVKKKPKQETIDVNLSEQLRKLVPDVDRNINQNDTSKIPELPVDQLSEILSKIDKVEVPKQLDFFEGRSNREFESGV